MGVIEPKYYEGGHCQSVLRPHRFFNIHPICREDGTTIVVMRATGEYTTMCVVGESPDTLQTLPQGPSRLALEGWYGFHMVFQERWSFLPRAHSPYPAQSRVAARAGFCDEWEKTPPLLENHEKCIFSHATLCCQNTANNKRSAGNISHLFISIIGNTAYHGRTGQLTREELRLFTF